MNDRDNMNTYLRSIATQAVQAQHTDNTELLWDLLTDIEKDVSLALNILEDIETTRERGDDDGIEYADPRDYKDGLE